MSKGSVEVFFQNRDNYSKYYIGEPREILPDRFSYYLIGLVTLNPALDQTALCGARSSNFQRKECINRHLRPKVLGAGPAQGMGVLSNEKNRSKEGKAIRAREGM